MAAHIMRSATVPAGKPLNCLRAGMYLPVGVKRRSSGNWRNRPQSLNVSAERVWLFHTERKRNRRTGGGEAGGRSSENRDCETIRRAGFMPGKLAGTIGEKRLPKIAAPIIRTCWINTFTRSSANEKCRRSRARSWKLCCWMN